MKFVVAIVHKNDADAVLKAALKASFRATRLSSKGGFLSSDNTTLLMGVEDERTDELIALIKKYSSRRKEILPPLPTQVFEGGLSSSPIEVSVGGATVFIIEAEEFFRV